MGFSAGSGLNEALEGAFLLKPKGSQWVGESDRYYLDLQGNDALSPKANGR